MRCGVFDSGIGGLTVTAHLLNAGFFEEIIYYGDTARVPYGNRNESTIIRYGLEGLEFLKNFNIDFLVVACNSVSAVALSELQREAPFPVVGVIEAGVRGVLTLSKDSPLLLIGTRATIGSKAYQKRLNQIGFKRVIAVPTPLFVPLVEEGIWDGKIVEEVFKLYFGKLPRQEIGGIILGCTHYPFLAPPIARYFPSARLVHSGEEIVRLLRDKFYLKPKYRTKLQIYASDNVEQVREMATRWLSHLSS